MEYLVTGGCGFIGSNLTRALVQRGARVRVLDNLSTGHRENLAGIEAEIELCVGDIRSREDVRAALRGVRYVLHAAALPSVARSVQDPWTTHDVNVNGTLNLLLACREMGVERLVFSSSSSVYGDTPELPKREDMRPEPRSPYALSKLTGEHYCRLFTELYGLATFSLRYFNVFGPRQDPTSPYAAVIPRFISALRAGRPPVIYGDGLQTRDFTYVDDVVEANLACCRAPLSAAGRCYNVAWGNKVSVLMLAQLLTQLMGVKIQPVHEAPRPGDVRDSQADSTLARERLGWAPRIPFAEGLRRTVEWFLSQP